MLQMRMSGAVVPKSERFGNSAEQGERVFRAWRFIGGSEGVQNLHRQVRSSEMTLMGKLMTSAGVLALSTGLAVAAPAMVENDLNLRAGPGVEFAVVAAMPGGATVDVMNCQAGWCQVAYGGTMGWASRAYLGLGGGVAAGPAYRGYGGSYAYRGSGYGDDEDTYAYGSYGPGYDSG